MTAPRRRSRRLASAAAAAAHCPLTDLPLELLARVISRCDPADIARVAAVSLLFHASLALEGIRLWAQERGFELPAQPEGSLQKLSVLAARFLLQCRACEIQSQGVQECERSMPPRQWSEGVGSLGEQGSLRQTRRPMRPWPRA